jgi:hypothetical protein
LNKVSLDDISDGYRTVLEIIVKTVRQTQTVLPDSQPARATTVPAVRQTQARHPCTTLILVKISKFGIHEKVP